MARARSVVAEPSWSRIMAATASTAARRQPCATSPDDLERDVAATDGLVYSVYLRFFSVHPKLSDALVARSTTVDGVNRLAFVANVDERLIDVGRFEREAGRVVSVRFPIAETERSRAARAEREAARSPARPIAQGDGPKGGR